MIGKRLKLLREEKGFNMRQMAEEFGLPYTTYVNYEKETRDPGTDLLVEMARYFDVSVDFLLGCSDLIKQDIPDIEHNLDYLKFALYGTADDIDDETIDDVKKYAAYARYIRQQKKSGNKE